MSFLKVLSKMLECMCTNVHPLSTSRQSLQKSHSLPTVLSIPSSPSIDLVFFGIQGSGKGTQAKKLASEFGYDIFEAGGELRKIAASGSELGKTVKSFIDQGHLVPFEIIMQVV